MFLIMMEDLKSKIVQAVSINSINNGIHRACLEAILNLATRSKANPGAAITQMPF